jgi:hypothetical protein
MSRCVHGVERELFIPHLYKPGLDQSLVDDRPLVNNPREHWTDASYHLEKI